MGLGNKLIVSATGFPGTNKTLRFIQDAFREPLGALAKLAGDKTIITGVVNTAGVVSNGFITYNGEIIPFVGGNYAATVTIIEEFENVNYNTDANDDTVLDSLPAYRTIYAMCGTGGIDIFNFSELSLLKTIKELSNFSLPAGIVIDGNYVHTDVNFTLALLNKLNGIQDGAQVNVKPSWTAPAGNAAEILNKPNFLLPLRTGTAFIYDIDATDYLETISFPSIGTANYLPILSIVSGSAGYAVDGVNYLPGWNVDNDFSYVIVNKTFSSFQIGFREYSSVLQNLRVDYILIPFQ